jgi:hypothetical protein
MAVDDFCDYKCVKKEDAKDIAKLQSVFRKIDGNTVELGLYNDQGKYIHSTVSLFPEELLKAIRGFSY